MPIRITCRDKWLGPRQVIERTGFIVPLVENPTASYTGRNKEPRIFGGSV